MTLETLAIHSRDGTRLHVTIDRHADPTARACLLLHGFGDGGYVWRDTRIALQDLCTTVVLDLRGHGDSERSRSLAYDLRMNVEDVQAVITALRLAAPIVVGHSFGGEIALRIAACPASQISAAVLVDSGPDLNDAASRQATAHLRQLLRTYSSVEEYCSDLMKLRPLVSAATARQLANGALRRERDGYHLKLDSRLLDHADEQFTSASEWQQLLPAIRCSTLVVRGAGSAMVSAASARQMLRLLPMSRLVTLPRAGHAVMSDNPPAFCACISGFIRETTAPSNHPHSPGGHVM
jgi:pimeloyl-ACP methyl ester carboxylesterase